eukprot:2451698-Pyramimonas_sp.AAC.1
MLPTGCPCCGEIAAAVTRGGPVTRRTSRLSSRRRWGASQQDLHPQPHPPEYVTDDDDTMTKFRL